MDYENPGLHLYLHGCISELGIVASCPLSPSASCTRPTVLIPPISLALPAALPGASPLAMAFPGMLPYTVLTTGVMEPSVVPLGYPITTFPTACPSTPD